MFLHALCSQPPHPPSFPCNIWPVCLLYLANSFCDEFVLLHVSIVPFVLLTITLWSGYRQVVSSPIGEHLSCFHFWSMISLLWTSVYIFLGRHVFCSVESLGVELQGQIQTQCLAWGWCTVMTQRDVMGREVGGGFMFGNACTPMVGSCQCMAKPI